VETTPRQTIQKFWGISDRTCDDLMAAKTNLESAGFVCLDNEFSSELLSELCSEAFLKKNDAVPVYGTSQCPYQAHLAGLDKAGIVFLEGGHISKIIEILFGTPLVLEESASCYTYYQPGDFLGAHLDHAEKCVVTVILYLDVVRSDKKSCETGLELHILGKSSSGEDKPQVIIPTKAGSLIIGLGSVNWHKRPTLQDGEFITALTACYSKPLSV